MEVLLALASGVLYAAGHLPDAAPPAGAADHRSRLAVERHESADLHRRRADAGAAAGRARRRGTAGRSRTPIPFRRRSS